MAHLWLFCACAWDCISHEAILLESTPWLSASVKSTVSQFSWGSNLGTDHLVGAACCSVDGRPGEGSQLLRRVNSGRQGVAGLTYTPRCKRCKLPAYIAGHKHMAHEHSPGPCSAQDEDSWTCGIPESMLFPAPSVTGQRFKFHTWILQPGNNSRLIWILIICVPSAIQKEFGEIAA